ncbi:active breakpoint cluster region-related protein isoform X2 [Chironomus tepperi]|uniref:active breakpoint cluster region-related protein isoform X2 n=1 Tax=Chironomus tepperi TaxID=113505 RepID=UPI00391FBB9E
MSVFSDFQRLWQEKFPDSDLSSAWIEDVQLSLTRHKEKILELTKELEQETLYVEYLERLLNEVEKYRDNGSNPALIFDAATPTINTSNRVSVNEKNGPTTDNKDTEEQKQQNQLIRAASTPATVDDDEEEQVRKKETDEVQLRRDGALNQFISELSSNIHGRRYSEAPSAHTDKQKQEKDSHNEHNIVESNSSDSNDVIKAEQNSTIETIDKVSDNSVAVESERKKSDLLAQPSHFVTVIEVKELVSAQPETTSSSSSTTTVTTTTSSFKAIRSGYENVIIENNKRNSNLISEMDRNSNTTSFNSVRPSAPSIALLQDPKKKIPPRPPPKFPRRGAPVEPPTVPILSSSPGRKDSDSSPSSSLERNVKPSEIFRQKSSDSLDIKSKKDITKFSKSSDLITDEFGKKLAKSESLKSTQSSSGSLGSRDTKSTASLMGSLEKINRGGGNSVGSKESLHSGLTSGVASTKIKSFESISSLSSESNQISQNIENEPYYDSVPIEANDSEYPIYVANVSNATKTNTMNSTGTTGSSSSRDEVLSNAGSTLPMSKNHLNSQTSVLEPESPGRNSNYVNIDYFLHQNKDPRNSSIDSDGELDINSPPLLRAISDEGTPAPDRRISSGTRGTIINQIISSIITSETLYVECLNKMTQYMKAIRATLTTSQPVILDEDFQTVFFKIEELNTLHSKFLFDLKAKPKPDNSDIQIGDLFKSLADNIQIYGAFLHNYGRAIDTVKKCGVSNPQFKEIVSNIILNSTNEQSLTLEDLLHKPVARVQKNALVLQDLLQHTPESHPDYQPLRQAHKITRNFLSEFNVIQTKSFSTTDDKALRRLVKNSFIVELADGHRKLRHLFLFNDVIACAKYKPSGRERFEFELKWYIPLKDIFIVSDESSPTEPKESSPVNIVQLKSQASTVRDQIMLEDRDEKKSGSRANDKHKKKLADIEAQLVLASPNLLFKIGNKSSGKQMTFFLSSDFERTQWTESILSLQKSCNLPGANSISVYELSAWISACQKIIKTEMGSYLMRNSRDESLLVGDLHFTVQGLVGLDHPADLYVCIEIDSYGHYFRKAKTKIICHNSNPMWNESFVLELEGSQNVRVLLYQDGDRPILRAKYVLELSRIWLKDVSVHKPLKMTDALTLNTLMSFIPAEISLRRVPTSKPGALFGAKLLTVLKREKRDIPFIISASIREVERRGMNEVGIYRVSGSASDLQKLKKSFESNAYEAEQLLKEVDIHSVTGILKSYLRELPEALFTDSHYQKFFDTFNQFTNTNETARIEALYKIFNELPQPNKATIGLILDHLIRVNHHEAENKMSLHNLAMVFGPTLLRPGPTSSKQKDLLESSTVDVMAQAGILYCFLQAKMIKP